MTQELPRTLDEAVAAVRRATAERLARAPDSAFYRFAADELNAIERRRAAGPPVDLRFYDGLTIGLMCARELEARDMPYCALVYRMLTLLKQAAAPAAGA